METPDGKKSMSFDMLLISAGMKPNSSGLNLDKIGVKTDKRGFIEVGKQMKSSVSNIFAIGDVAGGILLAHKASHEGIVAAEVIAGLDTHVDWKAVPYAVFTDPEAAGIGMTEKEAAESGRKIKVGKFPYRAIGKAVTIRCSAYMCSDRMPVISSLPEQPCSNSMAPPRIWVISWQSIRLYPRR